MISISTEIFSVKEVCSAALWFIFTVCSVFPANRHQVPLGKGARLSTVKMSAHVMAGNNVSKGGKEKSLIHVKPHHSKTNVFLLKPLHCSCSTTARAV